MRGTIIRKFSSRIFETPLKRPFVTALGRKTATCNVGFTVTLRDGTRGYGEASASLAMAHLRPAHLARVLQGLGKSAVGRDAASPRPLIEEAWRRHAQEGPATSAFECALLDAWTRSQGLSLASWFGGKLSALESDITISAWTDPELIGQAAAEAAQEGFRAFKVKVGGKPEDDIERMRLVFAAAGKSRNRLRFILDGNQGLTVSSALRLCEACRKSGIKIILIEQPLGKTDFKGMAELTKRSSIPVAADEMVQSPQDAVRVAMARSASVINIKVAKCGLLRALEIAAVARAAGMGLMIGCMAETSRGLMPSVHLALGTGFFGFVDLDSDHLLRDDDPSPDWKRRGPWVGLPDKASA
ncbi:MAG TPA: dipeptide epimerase [Elusimicrobia bacterium]|nr:dipeptide epimerase [Elusimicrobiota bacterium]HBT61164.1 dipeptide epimerase [Elusimicrobiota bacterium]